MIKPLSEPSSRAVPVSQTQRLILNLPQVGRLEWIGIRPQRGASMLAVSQCQVLIGTGLEGDRFKGRPNSTRQVTLIQAEHLPVIAALMGQNSIEPQLLRRNLVVSGINLIALKARQFRIGHIILEGTVPCAPCSKMEHALGLGGFNAMRGHGGLCARVLSEGKIKLGDPVQIVDVKK